MFSKLKTTISNHAEKVNVIKQIFLDEKKKNFSSDYYSIEFRDRKYREIKEKYDADRFSLIMQSKEELNSIFEDIFSSLETAITADVGLDAISELKMLSDVNISEFEMNAYSKKYSGKYAALRILKDIAEKNKIPFSFVSDNEIIADLDYLKSKCISFINIYDGVLPVDDYYAHLVYMSATNTVDNNLFTNIENEYNNFLKPVVG